MSKKRLPGIERSFEILEAARKVFAEHGYEGAKTQRIAAEARISEALVYRHFPSKLALYRAVLRQLIREQDADLEMMNLLTPSTQGIVASIRNYVETVLAQTEGRFAENNRLILASLAGEGGYVSLVYRRAQRKMRPPRSPPPSMRPGQRETCAAARSPPKTSRHFLSMSAP